MGHAAGESADPNAASFVKHAKALGLLTSGFNLANRWAYWLAGRAHFASCTKFSAALDDSRFETSSMCAVVGARQSSKEPFKVACSVPQEHFSVNH